MISEELLALADELEGMDCRTCPADGTKDCRDLPCEEAVARAASRRIREIAEHDACEEAVTTVSAYDLLPEEDLKALAWMREHGGLTFAGPIEGEDWWLGFDMGHYGDLDLSTLTPLRTDAECIAETEMLAEQLAERGA